MKKSLFISMRALIFIFIAIGISLNNALASISTDDYYPTAQGNSWFYEVTRSNPDGSNSFTRTEHSYIWGYETVEYPPAGVPYYSPYGDIRDYPRYGVEYTGYKFRWDDGYSGGYDLERKTEEGVQRIMDVYNNNNDSSYIYGPYTPADSAVEYPTYAPMIDMPRTVNIGDSAATQYNEYAYNWFYVWGPDEIPYNWGFPILNHRYGDAYTVDGFEDVTVPAGTFNNALKITSVAEEDLDQDPQTRKKWFETVYLAKGVGEIKWEELTSYGLEPPVSKQVGELSAYDVSSESAYYSDPPGFVYMNGFDTLDGITLINPYNGPGTIEILQMASGGNVIDLLSPDGSPIGFGLDTILGEWFRVGFVYSGLGDGFLKLYLDNNINPFKVISLPEANVDFIGGFSWFNQTFYTPDLGVTPNVAHHLSLVLSGLSDPELYLDDLFVRNLNSNAVPEPAPLSLLVLGMAGLLFRKRKRIA